jgi:hypothetical protein
VTLLRDALRDSTEPFTIAAQRRRHRVSYETARSDLLELEQLGLLAKQRDGKKFVYWSAPDLVQRLRNLGSPPEELRSPPLVTHP